MARTTRATLVAIAIAALAFGIAMFAHSREQHDTEIVAVALDPSDPTRTRIGQLEYLGGLDIPRMGQNIGGLSGLRWDAESGRLLAITDDARWVWITPVEKDARLIGISDFDTGNLLGPDGEVLTGKEKGDSEALVRDDAIGWAVAFERDHRILAFSNGLSLPSIPTLFKPEGILGDLEDNSGIEALAVGDQSQLICAQRVATTERANCELYSYTEDTYSGFAVHPPEALVDREAVPTDADALADGTYLILFRSWSSGNGNRAAIVTYTPQGNRRELMLIEPPLTVDNFEGLAVREEGVGEDRRTFLYIVSDDNFSSSQRTLLMKFEVVPEAETPSPSGNTPPSSSL